MALEDPVEVKAGLIKQDITLADHTGTARLVLWQQDVNKLKIGTSYQLENLLVKTYNGSKYFTVEKSGCSCHECDDIDIGEVDQLAMLEEKREIIDAEVVGVSNLLFKYTCFTCKVGTTFDVVNEKVGKCTKCDLIQRLDKCPHTLSAKLIVCAKDENHSLLAYLPTIKAIIKDNDLDDDTDFNDLNLDDITCQLLMASKFHITYTANNVIS